MRKYMMGFFKDFVLKKIKTMAVILILNILGGGFNYLFQIFCGRSLGPTEYGILGASLSVLNILVIFSQTIQKTISKYSSKLKALKEEDKIFIFIRKFEKKILPFQLTLLLIFLLLSQKIGDFLDIETSSLIIIAFIFVINTVLSILIGALNGIGTFRKVQTISTINFAFKLLLAILFILMGMGYHGALMAIMISSIIAILIGVFVLKEYLKHKYKNYKIIKDFPSYKNFDISYKEISNLSLPIMTTVLCLALLTNIDVLFVKSFFSSENTGYYLAALMIARILLFSLGPLLSIQFVNLSGFFEKGKDPKIYLIKNSAMIGIMAAIGMVIFIKFSDLIIKILYGSTYLPSSPLLSLIVFNIFFQILIQSLINYHLAVRKNSFLYILIPGTILEIILLFFFHDSLFQIIWVTIISLGIILFAMSIETAFERINKRIFKDKKKEYAEMTNFRI